MLSRVSLRSMRALTATSRMAYSNRVAENLVKVTFVDADGLRYETNELPGTRLIDAAVNAGAPIQAQCGGELACPTCHVVVPLEIAGSLPPISADESVALEGVDHKATTSRMGCMLKVDPFHNSIVFVPRLTPCC